MTTDITTDITKCIHCHKCRDSCDFLSKYNIDIGDGKRLKELAYSCFLCGTCTSVCPVGIDGRSVVLGYRSDRVADGSAGIDAGGYRGVLWEKRDYKFRNYRHAGSGSVLFPGCNFPSMYPRTMKKLEVIMQNAGIGTAYDCCGKPVGELGLAEDEERIVAGINARMKERGIREIITVCPNCYHFLNGRLDARMVSIYDKLEELGIGESIKSGNVYLPCPDRSDRELLDSVNKFCDTELIPVEGAQCCGLGGSAAVREPELAESMGTSFAGDDPLYVYCASCAGRMTRSGAGNIVHVLTKILGTDERPDTGKSAINRVLTRLK